MGRVRDRAVALAAGQALPRPLALDFRPHDSRRCTGRSNISSGRPRACRLEPRGLRWQLWVPQSSSTPRSSSRLPDSVTTTPQPGPPQQRALEARFQQPNLMTEHRLGDVEPERRLAEAAELGGVEEVLALLQIHSRGVRSRRGPSRLAPSLSRLELAGVR